MKYRLIIITLIYVAFPLAVDGQNEKYPEKADSTDFTEMSLEELMNVPITVASSTELSSRESPGVVTFLTETDIRNSGARDMIDILRLVPGFTPVYDTEGSVGFGTRGLFGYEGKISFMIDGIEINESLYGNTPFGNRIDVNQISKIEIIRGPGSSIYGGFAELAVINIITKKGHEINGLNVSGTYGSNAHYYARRNLSVAYGKKINDAEFSVSLFRGQAQRSIDDFTNLVGSTVSLKGNSAIDQSQANLNFRYKGLSIRTIYENYIFDSGPTSIYNNKRTRYDKFKSSLTEVKYDFKLSRSITLTPTLVYREQTPWFVKDRFDVKVKKPIVDIKMNYDVSKKINLIAGAGFSTEKAFDRTETPVFYSSQRTVSYNMVMGYLQLLVKLPVTVTLGGRFQYHNQYGDAFAPRLGLTKVFGKLHTKALFSQAFRVPAIMNILQANPYVTPEKTRIVEFEAGYQFTKNMLLNANFFDINVKDPLVLYIDDNDTFSYKNAFKTGSRGVEIEYRMQAGWGSASANYSYYTLAGKNEAPNYAVPGKDNISLGMPQHKIVFQSSVKATQNFSISATVNYFSKRYGIVSNNDGSYHFDVYSDKTLINLIFLYRNIIEQKLDVSFGIYDLMNERMNFIEGYDGASPPIPGGSREFALRVTARL